MAVNDNTCRSVDSCIMLGNDKRGQSEDVNVAEGSCHYSCARGNHGSPRLIRGCRLKRLQGFDHEAKSAN